ncbi:thioredoxin family protein [Spongiibacter sp. KMU-158]|uniref:Thioredoxin family protein n=1 Tax=Spongiibacter pelagi TaxID=2760804 RepID=A0A927GX74_9GAMM|nr:thioredoxin family protein [Spongiibacter pelagi]MBD2860225.1 thioredoxin family protein [Spongiibacter pelagi]
MPIFGHKVLQLFLLLFLANGVQAAELLYFYDPNCGACKNFDQQVGRIYSRTDEAQQAPMRKINIAGLSSQEIESASGIALKAGVVGTPTFVLADGETEIDRFSGYSNDELYWMSLQRLLNMLK